jgi:hypothetical protein
LNAGHVFAVTASTVARREDSRYSGKRNGGATFAEKKTWLSRGERNREQKREAGEVSPRRSPLRL